MHGLSGQFITDAFLHAIENRLVGARRRFQCSPSCIEKSRRAFNDRSELSVPRNATIIQEQ